MAKIADEQGIRLCQEGTLPRLLSRRVLLGAAAPLLLGGCDTIAGFLGRNAVPIPVGPVVDVALTASPLLNPDLFERPSPAVVRAYLLTNADAFGAAQFAALFEADTATLGPAMVARREVILTPGGVQMFTMELRPDVQALGVIVGYRSFERATWRATFPLNGHRSTRLRVDVNSSAVQIRSFAVP